MAEAKAPPAELAHHALAAKEWQAAFQHSLIAGDEAMRLYAVTSAIYRYETARRLLNEQRVYIDNATSQRLYRDLGKAFEIEFHQLDALAVYQEMQALAVVRGDREMELAALVASSNVRSMPYDAHDVAQAALLAEQALPLARALGDLKAEAQIEHSLGMLHVHGDGRMGPAMLAVLTLLYIARGEFSQAAHAAKQGLAIFDREGMLYPEWWEALPFPLAQGELALAQGDVAQAAACAEYLLEKFETQRLRHLLPGVFFSARASLWRKGTS